MRWIDISGYNPSGVWQAESARRTADLRHMSDEERKAALDNAASARHWSELRSDLAQLGHDKCWYTEAPIGAGDAHIEHFRPKRPNRPNRPDSHGGYWWLAFDARNYRLIASIPNRTKSNEFPIAGVRASLETDSLEDELPVLLDPTNADDVGLLTFGDGGIPVPAPGISDADRERVEYTVPRCGLDHAQICRQREAVWTECSNGLKEWLIGRARAGVSPGARARAEAAAARLRRMARPEAPYSRAAYACLSQKKEAVGLTGP